VEELPKGHRDAFGIGPALGIRHIWVESLCIKQNDETDCLEQSPSMASIYSNERCSIAATMGIRWDPGFFSERD
ncbi:hypothetical protein N657DRAFT_532337, partial [Parathielavia appendiculata]